MLAGLSSTVLASNGRNPGSLLLYPEFDNRVGNVTVLTVTNVDTDMAADLHIKAEFVYVGVNLDTNVCSEDNFTEDLSPGDTFTCLTDVHNPNADWGYVFIYAKELNFPNAAIKHNFLTGNIITLDGVAGLFNFEYSLNPVSFQASDGVAIGADGNLKLDNVNYTAVGSQILIPRFFGQVANRVSELILIGLTGGPSAETVVDLLIWNDNEEIFSGEYTFNCWERVFLADISGIFKNDFLSMYTNDDPDELEGYPAVETGWMQIVGAQYTVGQVSEEDPAVYAVLVEHIGLFGMGDLPFETGPDRTNGWLHRNPTPNPGPSR